MNIKHGDFYDEKFYGSNIGGMSKSASIVLDLIYKLYKPKTVVDVGCGQGAWLAAAESFGAKVVKGLDGEWVRRDALLSKNIDFMAVNFDEAMPRLNERYDLCISLEVAEHISEENAKGFVNLLCEASDTILFGAAIKYQGGMNHINEQWQSYWVELFRNNGYECFDLLRWQLWSNENVEWWYRQNTFLFVGPNNDFFNRVELRGLEKPILNIVHPVNYESKVDSWNSQINSPTLIFCVRLIGRYVKVKYARIIALARRWVGRSTS